MKLYYKPSTCALAPNIVLEWMKIDYELELAILSDPAFKAINPLLAVPALSTQELGILTECSAILSYLGRQPNGLVFGRKFDCPKNIYEFDFWESYFTGDLHPSFFPLFTPQRFTTDDAEEARAKVKASASKRIEFILQPLERRLSNHQFIIGKTKTIIDAYSVPMIMWLKSSLPDLFARLPGIAKHYELMAHDAGVVSALQKQRSYINTY